MTEQDGYVPHIDQEDKGVFRQREPLTQCLLDLDDARQQLTEARRLLENERAEKEAAIKVLTDSLSEALTEIEELKAERDRLRDVVDAALSAFECPFCHATRQQYHVYADVYADDPPEHKEDCPLAAFGEES